MNLLTTENAFDLLLCDRCTVYVTQELRSAGGSIELVRAERHRDIPCRMSISDRQGGAAQPIEAGQSQDFDVYFAQSLELACGDVLSITHQGELFELELVFQNRYENHTKAVARSIWGKGY